MKELSIFDEIKQLSKEHFDAAEDVPENDPRAAEASSDGFWDDAEVISVYTRAQAIEDGTLVDVSEMAREAGFVIPVAVTQAVWADINDIPASQSFQDVNGRLWDLLYMGFVHASKRPNKQEFVYELIMHQGRKTFYTAKIHIGGGDNGEAVLTIMRPEEDR